MIKNHLWWYSSSKLWVNAILDLSHGFHAHWMKERTVLNASSSDSDRYLLRLRGMKRPVTTLVILATAFVCLLILVLAGAFYFCIPHSATGRCWRGQHEYCPNDRCTDGIHPQNRKCCVDRSFGTSGSRRYRCTRTRPAAGSPGWNSQGQLRTTRIICLNTPQVVQHRSIVFVT